MWFGACTSSVGTWMQSLAQSWLVYDLSKDPFFLGLDAFLGQAPIMLLSMVGGVYADRQNRREELLVGDADPVRPHAPGPLLAEQRLAEVEDRRAQPHGASRARSSASLRSASGSVQRHCTPSSITNVSCP